MFHGALVKVSVNGAVGGEEVNRKFGQKGWLARTEFPFSCGPLTSKLTFINL
jgi:hypothetical protein